MMESLTDGSESKLVVGEVIVVVWLIAALIIEVLMCVEKVFEPKVWSWGEVCARNREESISTVMSLVFAGLSLAEGN